MAAERTGQALVVLTQYYQQLAQQATPGTQPFDDAARYQLVKYVAGGSGVADLTAWLGGYQ